jgi:hypothetical protein
MKVKLKIKEIIGKAIIDAEIGTWSAPHLVDS